jgi:dihydrofolate reductase
MRKLILRMSPTLDGVVAGENDEMDLFDFSAEGSWSDLFATLESVDAMILGRGMDAGYLGYWEAARDSSTATPNERKYAAISARTRHFVLSRSLRKVDWPNLAILGGTDALADLKRQRGGDIILYGGPTAAVAVLDAGLVDEIHLVVHPLIASRGKKLFANVSERRRVRHRDTKTFPEGLVALKYERA